MARYTGADCKRGRVVLVDKDVIRSDTLVHRT